MRPLSLILAGCVVLGVSLPSAARAATEEEKSSAGSEQEKSAPTKAAKKKPETKGTAGAGSARVFTNDDLERMFGTSGEVEPEAGAAAAKEKAPGREAASKQPPAVDADPLKALLDSRQRQTDRQQQLAEAERAVTEASERVRTLEKRALAIRNPFLPRPELSPEEAEAAKDLDGQERFERNEADLEEARKKLEEARARLASLASGS